MTPPDLGQEGRQRVAEATRHLVEAVALLKAKLAQQLADEGREVVWLDLAWAKGLGQQRQELLALLKAWPAEAPAQDAGAAGPQAPDGPECFGGLSPEEAVLTPQLVADALQATRQRLGLGGRAWSVVELALGPAERDWLRRWSQAMQPRILRKHLEAGHPWCDAQGLLLWVAFATWQREQGAEAQSWRAPQAGLNEDTANFLFTAQGQPSRLLKQALEAGAHRHQLRHAFHDAGTQAHTATLALQAGFTRWAPWAVAPSDTSQGVGIGWPSQVPTPRIPRPRHRRGLALLGSEGAWKSIRTGQSLHLNQAQHLSIQPPDRAVPWREWALLEGDVFVGRPHRGAIGREGLGGYGAPLRLRRGPHSEQFEGLALCREVIDQGAIQGLSWSPEGEPLLQLSRRLAWHPHHFASLWLTHGRVASQPVEEVVGSPGLWRVTTPLPADEVVAIVLQRGPLRLGHWTRPDWPKHLAAWPEGQEEQLAHFLRWAKLPLASEAHRAALRAWVAKHGPVVLATWLKAHHRNLSQTLDDAAHEAWWDVVRKLVPPEAAGEHQRLIAAATEVDQKEENVAVALVEQLTRIHPAMVLHFARSWAGALPHLAVQRLGQIQARLLRGQSEEDLLASFTQGGEEAHMDQDFVGHLLQSLGERLQGGDWLRPQDEGDLAVAVGAIDGFRRLASLKALQVMQTG